MESVKIRFLQLMVFVFEPTAYNFLQWYQKYTNVDDVIPVSAKYGHGVDDVKDWILEKLPFGPAYYPKVCIFLLLLTINYVVG